MLLDHRSHGAVQDQDAVLECITELMYTSSSVSHAWLPVSLVYGDRLPVGDDRRPLTGGLLLCRVRAASMSGSCLPQTKNPGRL
jgi:hypothetical protein